VSGELERKVRAVWALAPDVHCKGLCANYCGIIPIEDAERMVYAEREITIDHLADGTCDKLVLGRCSIYDDRPLICRMWGGVDQMFMRCPHGCGPMMHTTEARFIFETMENLT